MKVDSLFCEDIQYMSSLSIKYNFTNVKDGFFLSRCLCSYIEEIISFYAKVAYGMCQKLNLLPK